MNSRYKKAAELVVKHRATNLTCSDVPTKFGKYPRMAAVRGALIKEL